MFRFRVFICTPLRTAAQTAVQGLARRSTCGARQAAATVAGRLRKSRLLLLCTATRPRPPLVLHRRRIKRSRPWLEHHNSAVTRAPHTIGGAPVLGLAPPRLEV